MKTILLILFVICLSLLVSEFLSFWVYWFLSLLVSELLCPYVLLSKIKVYKLPILHSSFFIFHSSFFIFHFSFFIF